MKTLMTRHTIINKSVARCLNTHSLKMLYHNQFYIWFNQVCVVYLLLKVEIPISNGNTTHIFPSEVIGIKRDHVQNVSKITINFYIL